MPGFLSQHLRSLSAIVVAVAGILTFIIAKGFPIVKEWVGFKKDVLETEKTKLEIAELQKKSEPTLIQRATDGDVLRYDPKLRALIDINKNASSSGPQVGFSIEEAADLSNKEVQKRLSRSAIPAFFKITRAWQLREEAERQLLGGVSNGVFYQLKQGQNKRIDQDKLTRISLLLGIFRALNLLYSRKLADAWVNLPDSNPMLEGEAPLTYMMRGGVPALVRVRQLLDARRGGR